MDWKHSGVGLSIFCYFFTSGCVVSSSCCISLALPLACTEEEGERYLRAIAVMKPARGAAIRFLCSATAQPLEADRLCSALLQSALHCLFTRTERWSIKVIEFNMTMFLLDLLYQFSILFEIGVALLFLFCLKLKSGLFKRIFPTVQSLTNCQCNAPESFSHLTDVNCSNHKWVGGFSSTLTQGHQVPKVLNSFKWPATSSIYRGRSQTSHYNQNPSK